MEEKKVTGKLQVAMRKNCKKTMKQILEEHEPEEMSKKEKDIMSFLVPETDALAYELKPLKMLHGHDELVYDIPASERYDVLKQLWPFDPCPGADERLFDIHERKYFIFKEAQVIRCRGRNFIVSPYYAVSGGCAVDFIPDEATETFVQKVEK